MAFIQLRNVPDDVRERAKERAAARGQDLSTYVRLLLERDLAMPSMSEWLDEVAASPIRVKGEFDAAAAVRESRDAREEELARRAGR